MAAQQVRDLVLVVTVQTAEAWLLHKVLQGDHPRTRPRAAGIQQVAPAGRGQLVGPSLVACLELVPRPGQHGRIPARLISQPHHALE